MNIRPAQNKDLDSIEEMLFPYIEKKIILPRSREQLKKFLPNTWIIADQKDLPIAVASLYFYQSHLVELRGLAVSKQNQKQGLGKKLVLFLTEHLRKNLRAENPLSSLRFFALTFTPNFFLSCGFKIVPKDNFPEKIFEVCNICDLQNNCKEIAVEMIIERKKL